MEYDWLQPGEHSPLQVLTADHLFRDQFEIVRMTGNIVVLCLDSVRKDYFDEYAQQVQNLASISLDEMRSASSWSTPSHASMVTGLLPSEHGFHRHNNDFADLKPADTFLSDLPHRTTGISANVFVGPEYGFESIFDDFTVISTGKRYGEGLDPNRYFLDYEGSTAGAMASYLGKALRSENPKASLMNGLAATANVVTREAPIPKLLDDGANAITREVLSTLREQNEPSFIFTNFADAHVPLRPIRGFDSSLYEAPPNWSTDSEGFWDVVESPEKHKQYLQHHRNLYAAAIEYLDRKIAELVHTLRKEISQPTIVVVTADHGENLGEPENGGLIGHKSSLSEALLHVPFYVIDPPESTAISEEDFTSLMDLGDIVRAIDSNEEIEIDQPHVFAEVVGMSPGPEPPSAESYWDRMLRAAYGEREKFVWDSTGAAKRFRISGLETGRQDLVERDVTLPKWATKPFEENVRTYKEMATEVSHQREIGPHVEDRLAELGYR